MLNYQIALTNAIFDDTYRNVLRFDTRVEQEAYFNVNTLFANNPDLKCNFHVGALYATSVVVDVNTDDLNEALNYNYCIVKDMTANAVIKYYYYFVKKAQQDNGNRLICDLELDVYQTYYIDLNFGDCTIVRAHLNRFVDNGDNTVSFDASPTSKLFEREEIQDLPKRLTNRTQINVVDAPGSTGNLFDKNILCWAYIYLDPTTNLKFITPDGQQKTVKPPRIEIDTLPTNIAVLAMPIYKNESGSKLTFRDPDYINTGYQYEIGGIKALEYFETLNNGYTHVYSVKLSLMPPGDMEIAGNGIVTELQTWTGSVFPQVTSCATGTVVGLGNGIGAFLLTKQKVKTYNFNFIDNFMLDLRPLTFNKNEIIGADTHYKFNPKINNSDYYEFNIVDNFGNSFTYDYQKLNTQHTLLEYSEPLTPDFTKSYARLIPPVDNTLYVEETTENLLGLVTNNDNTVLLPTSAYQSMIANNKNFFQQKEFNRNVDLVQNAFGAAKSLFGGDIFAPASVALDYYKSVQNQNYEIDNLRNAPGSLQAANGNFIFGCLYTRPAIYLEEYDITENSKKAVNDFMCLYGFNYNRIDNIKNVDNIRKNYNYVKAYVEEINTGVVNISNIVHNKIREIFANGVRMWNLREFTYNKENYERWLEE